MESESSGAGQTSATGSSQADEIDIGLLQRGD